MTEEYGNPSSLHTLGQSAQKILRTSRSTLAKLVGVHPAGVIFTSGGTESDNLIFASLMRDPSRITDRRIIISGVEHPAVSAPAERLGSIGAEVVEIPCHNRESGTPGLINMDALADALDAGRADIVSVMAVNSEIGTIQPLEDICRAVRSRETGGGRRTTIHSDAVQAFCKLPLPKSDAPDAFSVSAHKIHGPKGVGALCCAHAEKLFPLIFGGGQERGFRSGTENLPGICGFAEAAAEAASAINENAIRVAALRARLRDGIIDAIPDAHINSPFEASAEGASGKCSPYILSVSFLGTRGEVLVHDLEQHGVLVSTGSACSSIGKKGGSNNSVLHAIGLTNAESDATLRFSFSRYNTEEEIDYTLTHLTDVVSRFRKTGTYR
jgi:cysteine desulfurase